MAIFPDDGDASKVVGENVSGSDSVHEDDEMMNISVLSSATVFSALIHTFISSALSDFISFTLINPLSSFYTNFSLSLTLQEALHIFHDSLLYPSHSPPSPTASMKTHFHTQTLYDTICFTSYLSVASLAQNWPCDRA
ncbi:hypothetical protein I7I48_01027 [Histoplasma ohiense]|nr:hypothetical protein I7I48_01027 [Histoplasma ohiense (nom. inval.)]